METTPSPSAGTTKTSSRRRRSPEVALAEILTAAEDLLSEVAFRDMSIDDLMGRTTLSRSSFYVYFRDRYDLLLRLVGELGDELQEMADRWLTGTGDPRETIVAALEGIASVYERHAPLMRAITEAASSDPLVESVHTALIERFVDATATHVEEELECGKIVNLHAYEASSALVWMTERYLYRGLTPSPPRISRETAVDTLIAVWARSLYGT